MLKKLLLGVFAILVIGAVALGIGIAMQPDEYNVTRSATIAAPADGVFARVNDFHKWEAWSPWAKLDPNMKTSFSGSESGKGSVYSWVGDDKVGEGKMTITDSTPPSEVKILLEFIKPFASTANTVFAFKPNGGGTDVTWSMSGKHTFLSKAMCLFLSMDKMIGPDFEKGLAQLKTVSESSAAN